MSFITNNHLGFLIATAAIGGVGLGVYLHITFTSKQTKGHYYIQFPGLIVLNILQMLIVPTILSCFVTIVTTLGSAQSGRLLLYAIIYYIMTTVLSLAVGLVLIYFCFQSEYVDTNLNFTDPNQDGYQRIDSVADFFGQMFPDNLVLATFEKTPFSLLKGKCPKVGNSTSNSTCTGRFAVTEAEKRTNVIGIMSFSIFLGLVINKLEKKGKPLKIFFQSLDSIVLVIINYAMWCIPVGSIFLIASRLLETDSPKMFLIDHVKYTAILLVGLAVHMLVTLPLIYLALTSRNPIKLMVQVKRPLYTAWYSSSSITAYPSTVTCLSRVCNLAPNTVDFLVSLSATVNKDGTSMYVAVATVYILKITMETVVLKDILVISVISVLAVIPSCGLPQSGLISLSIALTALRIPEEELASVLAMDWLLDHFRTLVNVWGDCVGVGVMDYFFQREEVEEEDKQEYVRESFEISVLEKSYSILSVDSDLAFDVTAER